MNLKQFIQSLNLSPGDAVELVDNDFALLKHYAIYVGDNSEGARFVANTTNGTEVFYGERLHGFIKQYTITNVEKFAGSELQRRFLIRKALSKVGQKAYNLIFNNCEHFKNWVLYGKKFSKQVTGFGLGVTAIGVGLYLLGNISGNKKMKKTGEVVLFTLAVIIITLFILWKVTQKSSSNED